LGEIGAYELRGDPSALVSDVAYDSRACTAGGLFFCVPGGRSDGHSFAPDAVARGAGVLFVERWLHDGVGGATQVFVPSVREVMGSIAAEFFDRPADRITVVGVTGTNGKTTTTYLMESVFGADGTTAGVIGTTGVRIAGEAHPAPRTTPEAPDVHRLLRRMADAGVGAVAMEVSSHGLHQHRVGGIRFSCAIFTNLTQDHLDYHGTMESYFEAKAMLFDGTRAETAVVNSDDEYGRRLLARGIGARTFGVGDEAEFRATDIEVDASGVRFEVSGTRVVSPLRGVFNVQNCLAAFACARVLGIDGDRIVEGIAGLRGVPGRLEPVETGQPFTVLVDYAHTPDSIENVLRAVRPLTSGRVIVLLGCGGDRDRGKRPLMGRAATSLADLAIITSDNPRSEDPDAIIAEMVPGARQGGGAFHVDPDRRSAIREALAAASPGDVVVLAGKGHETGQEFADHVVPFDDREVARDELSALAGESR
jgi:UDP-N-acetylmuramoyl-L-alanyl-D-glutamate--2,6-diaminopimelate ligase